VQLRHSLDAAHRIGDQKGIYSALRNLGNAYRDCGEPHEAINYLEQALHRARSLYNLREEGRVLGNLGATYVILGEMDSAVECLKQALRLARQIGDRYGEGRALSNLGVASWERGDFPTAIDYLHQRLDNARALGERHGESSALLNLGNVYAVLGEQEQTKGSVEQFRNYADQAIGYYEQHQVIAHALGDRRGEGLVLQNVGNVRGMLGQYVQANTCYEKALVILNSLDAEGDVVFLRWDYGVSLIRQGDRERGIALMMECVVYEERIKHTQAAADRALVDHLQAGGQLPA
jgi:tetratricopeptide (TPR) repeat protein